MIEAAVRSNQVIRPETIQKGPPGQDLEPVLGNSRSGVEGDEDVPPGAELLLELAQSLEVAAIGSRGRPDGTPARELGDDAESNGPGILDLQPIQQFPLPVTSRPRKLHEPDCDLCRRRCLQ